jgi:hypothetical protein
MKIHRLGALAASFLSLFCGGPAGAQTPDGLIAQIKVYSADLAQGRACSWMLPFDEIAMTGKIAESAALVRANFGPMAGNEADAVAKAKAETEPCAGEANERKRSQVTMLRLEWLARADVFYTISESAPFGKDMTSLGSTHAQRRREFAAMRDTFVMAVGEAQWQPLFDDIVSETQAMVGLVCADRANLRSASPRQCPAVPDNARKFIPLAVAQLKSVEAFADSFAQVLKVVTPPGR